MKNIIQFLFILIPASVFSQSLLTPEKAAENILQELNNKEYSKITPLFDQIIAAKMNDVQLGQTYESILQKVGAFQKSETSPSERKMDGSIVVDQLCSFENTNLIFRIKFNEQNKISGFQFLPTQPKAQYKVPSYAKPDEITEQEVKVGTGKFILPGILTLPKTGNNFPLVILVHGSGPNDMDETIGPNKIFKDLALGLASKGIAVLRYDKRTLTYGSQMMEIQETITVKEETTDDVKAAIQLSKTIKSINPKQIFIAGHSLGAMLAPRIAQENSGLAGIILLAGNARPMEDLIPEQMDYILRLDDFTAEDEKKMDEINKQTALVKSGKLNSQTSMNDLPLQLPASYWIDLNKYNQLKVASELKLPIMIMQGKRDYQVTEKEYNLWKQSLSKNKNVTFHLYDKLNHVFIEGPGVISNPKEYDIPGNVPEYVIDDLFSFIK
jgi:uncharacterized protein